MRTLLRRLAPLSLLALLPLSACGGDSPGAGSDQDLGGLGETGGTSDATDSDTGADARDGGTDCAIDAEGSGGVVVPGCGEPTCEGGCSDGNPCTMDSCVEGIGCSHEVMEECCADDQCTIEGECFDNQSANPDNSCEVCNIAVAIEGWSPDDSASCDDGTACTAGDHCSAGACIGAAILCDDGDACTDDACNPETGLCTVTSNSAVCDDGDPCTIGDTCAAGTCGGTGTASCDDGNTCTSDRCEAGVGCVTEPLEGGTCDDGADCTAGDTCAAGVCSGTADTCDDGNFCTADYCAEGAGCGAITLDSLCADSNPCTDEACDPAQGCVYPFNTEPCDDLDLCTEIDTCTLGACLGSPVNVDDLNPCTDDSCDPLAGPAHDDNTLACDDLDACTVGDRCADGSCVPGTEPLVCDDGNFCTDDSCDSTYGCEFTNHTRVCDDGDMCTQADACAGGVCDGAPVVCDDNRSCTTDSCNSATGCVFTLEVSNDCRPDILVDYPPRAATILGTGPQAVTVTGSVRSGAGPLTSFTINGVEIAVTPVAGTEWDYTFSYDMAVDVGHNQLVILATDDFGTTRKRSQGFHWSRTYTNPDPLVTGSGMVDPGLALWLAQSTIDDGAPPPPTDLAAIFQQVLAGFDINSFFDPNEVLASQAGFDIYIRALRLGGTAVSLAAIDGGLRVTASLLDITGDLFFDCTGGIFSSCWFAGGDSNGGLSIDSVVVTADLMISTTADHQVAVSVINPVTTINSLDVWSNNGWTNFLLSIVEVFIRDSLVGDLEAELNAQLSGVVGPLLADALSGLAFNMAFDLPRLDQSGATVPVALSSDFSFTDFQDAAPGPQGGALGLRARATTPARGVAAGYPFDDNLGTPHRIGCGDAPQRLVIPRVAPVEVVFADDTLNQILHAAWWGGFLDFPVDASLLGDVDLGSYGISNLTMHISGWLPPVASDCGDDGRLLLRVGDLRVDADLELFGQPMTLVVWVSFDAPISLGAADGELGIVVSDIENVELEVNVVQEDLIASEAVIETLLRDQLVPALGGLLGGGEPLASFPLPEIDLSESLGLPPGSVFIAIEVLSDPGWETRIEGNTIVYGRLQ